MSKRRKWIILLACGVFALAVLWQLLRDREPSYEGRTLSQWVDRLQQSTYNDAEAQGAIRAIGTNAIPTSLSWISYEASPFRNRLADLVARLSPRLKSVFLSPERRAYDAMDVFAILGPDAHAAIPELTRFAQTFSDPDRPDRCIQVLSRLGPKALPSLLALATNSPPKSRIAAITMLRAFGTNAVPFLIHCLADKDSFTADAAEDTLSRLDQSAVLPSLTKALHSPSAQVRTHAVNCIMWLRTPISEAMPLLDPLLTDPEYSVRHATTNALQRLASPPAVRYQTR